MRSAKPNTNRLAPLASLAAAALLLAFAGGAGAAEPKPIWRIDSLSNTSAQPPSVDDPATAEHTFRLEVANVGDAIVDPSSGPIELSVELPPATGAVSTFLPEWECPGLLQGAHSFTCAYTGGSLSVGTAGARRIFPLEVSLDPAASGTQTATFAVSGAGAGSAVTADPVRISAGLPGFGLDAFDTLISGPSGQPFAQAGGHPTAIATSFDLNTSSRPEAVKGDAYPIEAGRDVIVSAPAGLVGNVGALPQCTIVDLAQADALTPRVRCATASQVGMVDVRYFGFNNAFHLPLFNIVPGVGEPARFGFNVAGTVVLVDTRLRSEADYGVDFVSHRISEGLAVAGARVRFWGSPSDHSHDIERVCPTELAPFEGGPVCPATALPPFVRMPTACTPAGKGLPWKASADSWAHPGREISVGRPDLSDPAWDTVSIESHELPGYPLSPDDPSTPWGEPQGPNGCGEVPVQATLSAKPTALEAETSSGLDVHVDVPQSGLELPDGIATSDIEAVEVSLPRGMTINPSQAEGLGVCSQARYESSELSLDPDGSHGCPSDSKIGTVSVKTPLLNETLPGNVYVAAPYENPFGSLLAIYVVIEEPQRGVLVKLAGEVRTNERTGQIETEFEDLPQQPFSSFDFHFREGARAPLVTPATCGSYETEALFTPWSDPSRALRSTSSFQVTKGIGGGPCPADGTPGFSPGFSAGSLNNNAGSFSPFSMRLTRNDGEQDMTRFSSVLPPGVSAKIAGVSKCPEAAIAAAKTRTGPGGGRQELAAPSCPAGSAIGRTLVGAGVGSVLTHVPGSLYLAGPYHGAPLSVVAITPAVAGPFDVGTVVVREALTLDPRTAEVHVDGAASDPIPHILKGIPLKLRDLRVYVDRPDFTINPTSCDPDSVRATLFGSAQDVFDPADDLPVALSSRYQAANCSRLGFRPRLSLKLKGGTKRGGHPALRAVLRPRSGNANLSDTVVALPPSAFLDQGHIRTVCTRVQFAAGGGNGAGCPKGSVYGHIRAFTPLLDEALEGPAYLRSSNHKLPDLVFALHGVVDIEAVGRIDSVRGGIRASFEGLPDAPIARAIVDMQGARKGLIVNSRNLCRGKNKADVDFTGQNGKRSALRPRVKPECRRRR